MNDRPIRTHGTLRRTDSGWSIDIDSTDPALEVGMPVDLVCWDARDPSGRSEVERIAAAQQLPVDIVAIALTAEGAVAPKS